MNLSIGIVGLPNVGKSTLFNALLKKQVALAANYPFATIDPNTGVVAVPDKRLETLAQLVGTSVIKPATVDFVDIAGLVKGASAGEGLGNKFLAHIREVSLVAHVVRAFSDENVIREGSTGPQADKETIETELLLADLGTLEKQLPPKGSKDKELLFRWEVTEKLRQHVGQGGAVRDVISSPEEQQVAQDLGLLTAKHTLFVVNVDEAEVANSAQLRQEYAAALTVPEESIVIVSAKIEAELAVLSDEDQALYLQDLGLKESGLERLASKAYRALGLQSFLTAGEKEVRAWTITQGTTAPKAAAVIHTDFEKNFIKARVVSYDDFVALGGWKQARESGKQRLEGKDYVMQEGDVVEFMIGG